MSLNLIYSSILVDMVYSSYSHIRFGTFSHPAFVCDVYLSVDCVFRGAKVKMQLSSGFAPQGEQKKKTKRSNKYTKQCDTNSNKDDILVCVWHKNNSIALLSYCTAAHVLVNGSSLKNIISSASLKK